MDRAHKLLVAVSLLVLALGGVKAQSQPELSSFSLNLTIPEQLLLTFTSNVDPSTCNIQAVTLQNSATLSQDTAFYTFQNGSCDPGLSGNIVSIVPGSMEEWSVIQGNLDLATNVDNTFLSLGGDFIMDGNGMNNSAISSSNALQVASFTENLGPPIAFAFGLDLNSGFLGVLFSEAINVSAVNISGVQLSFRNATTNSSDILTFSQSTVIMVLDPGVRVAILLQITELFILKLSLPPFVLSLAAGSFIDGDGMPSLEQTEVQLIGVFPDATPPGFLAFSIDLDAGVITLQFDEPMSSEAANFSGVYLMDSLQSSPVGYDLSDSMIFSDDNYSTVLTVRLSIAVLNTVKNDATVCTSLENCFIFLDNSSFSDVGGNAILSSPSSIQPQDYIPDVTRPVLNGFSLDLNTGILALTFDEPIDIASLDGFAITIQNSGQTNTIDLGSVTISSTLDFNTVLLLNTSSVLNEIKALVASALVFLSMEDNAVSDTNGNPVPPISPPLFITSLVPDTTPPSLVSFTPSDPTDRQIVFFFDEYVSTSSWNGNQVILALPTAQGTFNYSGLTQGTIQGSDMDSITYNFSNNEFVPPLSDYYSNAYYGGQFGISAAMGLISDLSDNLLMPSVAIYHSAVPDTFNPILRMFSLDMDEGIISVTFSEAVNVSVANVAGAVTLQDSSSSPAQSYTLTDATINSTLLAMDVVSIFLSVLDINNLKLNAMLATSVTNAYLILLPSFSTDLSGNPLAAQPDGLQASSFTPDTQGAVVLSFELDLDADIMSLQFDEPVRVTTFDATGVILTNSNQSLNSVQLQNVVLVSQGIVTEFDFMLSVDDTLSIKSQPLCSDASDCFATFAAALILDTNSKPSVANVIPFAVSIFTPDTTRPQFLQFSIDINTGTITLQFNEPMSLDIINFSSVYLTGTLQNSPSGYPLNGSMILSVENFSTVLIVMLSPTALNAVKSDTAVCTSLANCLIFITESGFFDSSGNPVVPLASSTLSSSLTEDSTSPSLQSFALDLDNGWVILTFDEPVDVGTLDPFGISILNSDQTTSVNLENAIVQVAESFNTILVLAVGTSTLNEIKVFFASNTSIYMTLQTLTVTDTSGNSVVFTSLQLVQSVTPDMTAPFMLLFTPSSPDLRRITFSFDEFVNSSSWNGDQLTLSLTTPLGTFNYSGFTQGTFNSSDTDAFTYAFADNEFVPPFSTHYTIAYNGGLFELFTSQGLITDLSGNTLLAITMPLSFNNSIDDTVSPMLFGFAFDLNTGTLTTTFSEEISVISVASRVRLQNSATQPANVYTLQQNSTVTLDPGLVLISIDRSDLNNLKLNSMLATSIADTYLVLLPSFATDLSGNPLAAQPDGLQASSFTPDTQGAVVLSFELDLDADIMSLQFDEPVRVSTFDHSVITLTNSNLMSGSEITAQLLNVEVLHESNAVVEELRFLLGLNESILVKSQPLCYTEANCFVVIDNGAISDLYANPSVALVMPLQVINLIPDVSPPRLVNFSEFDLNAGTFTLIFSEPVNTSSVEFAVIQFTDDPTNPTVAITLTDGSASPDHIEIDFFLSTQDLNMIKLFPELCTGISNCWIRLPSFFISDVASNPFLHSNFGANAQASFDQPLSFVPDTTRPEVLYFSVDLNVGNMVLYFDEVILETTFTPSDITLLNAVSGSISFPLSGQTNFTHSVTGNALNIFFTVTDLNRLKSNSLYASPSDSFLAFSTVLTDSSGNILTSILAMDALQVSNYTADQTRPVLSSFDLFNIDNGTFIITFDEPVNITSIRLDLLTFLSEPDSLINFTLSGGMVDYLDDTRLSVVVSLSRADRTQLKLLSGLAISENTTYIAIQIGMVLDTAGNVNVPIVVAEPLQLSSGNFVLDTTPAMLSSFELDLDLGVLKLTFTDVITISSVDIAQLTIQNNQQTASVFHRLGTVNFPAFDSDVIEITFSAVDLNELKFNLELATNVSNTFISFTADFAQDIEGRNVIGIMNNASIGVDSFTPDTSSPSLLSFSLDMNTGLLECVFSEPIFTESVNITDIVFQNGLVSTSSLALSGGSVQTNEVAALTATIALTVDSLNMLKSTANVATALTDTYINITSAFAVDTSRNNIAPTVLNAEIYTSDTVSPELLYFDTNLTSFGRLTMKFSEAVQFSNAVEMTILLQSSQSGEISLQLTSEDLVSLSALDELEVRLQASITTRLLTDPMIGSSVDTLFLSLAQGGVTDFNDNPAAVIPSNQALRVRFLYRPCFETRTFSDRTSGMCEPCSNACVDSCTGALPLAGEGGCEACYIALLDVDGEQDQCIAQSEQCPLGYYNSTTLTPSPSTIAQSTCKPCHSECLLCSGVASTECQACNSAYIFTPGTTGITECLATCSGSSNPSLCQTCHAQCDGCDGPRSEDCIRCRENELIMADSLVICVPNCSQNEYLTRISNIDFEYECRPCNDQCSGCVGPANTQCLRCQNTNSTVEGVTRCLVECPRDDYNSNGQCLPCDDLCNGCIGPSASNCTACSQEAVQAEEGCVPLCSFGLIFDTSINGCRLTQALEIVVIVCSVVGVMILIVSVLIVVLCLLRRFLREKSSEPVFIGSKTIHELTTKL